MAAGGFAGCRVGGVGDTDAAGIAPELELIDVGHHLGHTAGDRPGAAGAPTAPLELIDVAHSAGELLELTGPPFRRG